MVPPGALHHGLIPGFMDTHVGCVNETTQDEVCEVSYKVIKCHPAGQERNIRWMKKNPCFFTVRSIIFNKQKGNVLTTEEEFLNFTTNSERETYSCTNIIK